jgi:predicted RND superfamily exporter protein
VGTKPSGASNEARMSGKGPLIFSAVLAVIAGFFTMIFSTGGAGHELRWDLGITAAGIAFIASLLVVAVLTMAGKENPEHLSEGSGVNRVSSKIPGGAGSVGNPRGGADVPRPGTPAGEDRDPDNNDDGGAPRNA